MIYPLISALTLINKLGICIAIFAIFIIAEIIALAMLVKWKKNFKALDAQKGAEKADTSAETQQQEKAEDSLQSDVKAEQENVETSDNAEQQGVAEDDNLTDDVESIDNAEIAAENQADADNVQETETVEPAEAQDERKDDKWSAFAFAPLMTLSAAAQVTSVRYLLYALIGVSVVLGAVVLLTAVAFAKSLNKAPKQEEPQQDEKQVEEQQAEQPVVEDTQTEEEQVEDVAVEDSEEEQPQEEAVEPVAEVAEEAEETVVEPVALEEEEVTVEVAEEQAEDLIEEEQVAEPVVEEPIVEEAPIAEEVAVVEEPKPEPAKQPVKRQPVPREQTVVVDNQAVLIKDDRFLFNPEEDGWYYLLEKTFTAKLIQSEDIVKDYYTELKNELLAYKKVHARMSKKRESFNFGRNCLVRMTIRGKTLRLHFALDAKDYEDTKYKVEDTSDIKSLADTPLMYRIKNERRLRYAKDLIAAVMAKYGVQRQPIDPIFYNYADDLPYETTPPLIERGLIIKRRVRGKIPEDKGFDFAKKTFKAKLIQSDDTVKEYYSQIKNHLLSYRKIHDRMSKARESYRFGRTCVARMSIRGKTLKLYLALDAKDYLESKYTIEDASSVKSVADTPLLIKIKNNRRLKHALELIDVAMANVGTYKRLNTDETDYVADLPFEDTEELFEQGLIVNVHVSGNSFFGQRMAARQANSEAAADEDEE